MFARQKEIKTSSPSQTGVFRVSIFVLFSSSFLTLLKDYETFCEQQFARHIVFSWYIFIFLISLHHRVQRFAEKRNSSEIRHAINNSDIWYWFGRLYWVVPAHDLQSVMLAIAGRIAIMGEHFVHIRHIVFYKCVCNNAFVEFLLLKLFRSPEEANFANFC